MENIKNILLKCKDISSQYKNWFDETTLEIFENELLYKNKGNKLIITKINNDEYKISHNVWGDIVYDDVTNENSVLNYLDDLYQELLELESNGIHKDKELEKIIENKENFEKEIKIGDYIKDKNGNIYKVLDIYKINDEMNFYVVGKNKCFTDDYITKCEKVSMKAYSNNCKKERR